MVRNTLLSQDASTHQIWDSYLKSYKRCALHTIILKTVIGHGHGYSVLKMLCTSPPSQDAFTHQILEFLPQRI